MITASDILNRFRKVKPAVKRVNTWMSLLRIAEAGAEGIKLSQLNDLYSFRKDNLHRTLQRYVKLQLIYFEDRIPTDRVSGRICRFYFPTPLLYQLLDVKRPQP